MDKILVSAAHDVPKLNQLSIGAAYVDFLINSQPEPVIV